MQYYQGNYVYKLIKKLQYDIKEISTLESIDDVRERTHRLINLINRETANNRLVFMNTPRTNNNFDINLELNAYLNMMNRSILDEKWLPKCGKNNDICVKKYGA